jgi:hypothetical protein
LAFVISVGSDLSEYYPAITPSRDSQARSFCL